MIRSKKMQLWTKSRPKWAKPPSVAATKTKEATWRDSMPDIGIYLTAAALMLFATYKVYYTYQVSI